MQKRTTKILSALKNCLIIKDYPAVHYIEIYKIVAGIGYTRNIIHVLQGLDLPEIKKLEGMIDLRLQKSHVK